MIDLTPGQWVAILAPVIALQLALLFLAARDLIRPERRVRGGNKAIWALVIVFINIIGPVVYFLAGRENE